MLNNFSERERGVGKKVFKPENPEAANANLMACISGMASFGTEGGVVCLEESLADADLSM